MEQVESWRGKAAINQLGGLWEVELTSYRTGDVFTLKSTDERRAYNKYFQFKAWVNRKWEKEKEQ
jgi:hypothetical protein